MLRATTACTSSTSTCHRIVKKWSEPQVFWHFLLRNVLRATTACTFSTCALPKVTRSWGALYIFTWKCASRHNGVHFFDITTSKSGPNPRCFATFDFQMCLAPQRRALFPHRISNSRPRPTCFDTFYFQMCFAPQWRALFQHLNYQKWLGADVFCTFLLRLHSDCIRWHISDQHS